MRSIFVPECECCGFRTTDCVFASQAKRFLLGRASQPLQSYQTSMTNPASFQTTQTYLHLIAVWREQIETATKEPDHVASGDATRGHHQQPRFSKLQMQRSSRNLGHDHETSFGAGTALGGHPQQNETSLIGGTTTTLRSGTRAGATSQEHLHQERASSSSSGKHNASTAGAADVVVPSNAFAPSPFEQSASSSSTSRNDENKNSNAFLQNYQRHPPPNRVFTATAKHHHPVHHHHKRMYGHEALRVEQSQAAQMVALHKENNRKNRFSASKEEDTSSVVQMKTHSGGAPAPAAASSSSTAFTSDEDYHTTPFRQQFSRRSAKNPQPGGGGGPSAGQKLQQKPNKITKRGAKEESVSEPRTAAPGAGAAAQHFLAASTTATGPPSRSRVPGKPKQLQLEQEDFFHDAEQDRIPDEINEDPPRGGPKQFSGGGPPGRSSPNHDASAPVPKPRVEHQHQELVPPPGTKKNTFELLEEFAQQSANLSQPFYHAEYMKPDNFLQVQPPELKDVKKRVADRVETLKKQNFEHAMKMQEQKKNQVLSASPRNYDAAIQILSAKNGSPRMKLQQNQPAEINAVNDAAAAGAVVETTPTRTVKMLASTKTSRRNHALSDSVDNTARTAAEPAQPTDSTNDRVPELDTPMMVMPRSYRYQEQNYSTTHLLNQSRILSGGGGTSNINPALMTTLSGGGVPSLLSNGPSPTAIGVGVGIGGVSLNKRAEEDDFARGWHN